MRRLTTLGLALSSALLAATAGAQSVTLDFQQYASATTRSYGAAIGDPLHAGPIDIYDTELFVSGALNSLATWGTADPGAVNRPVNVGSATTMFAAGLGEEIDLYPAGADVLGVLLGDYSSIAHPFTIRSIDVAHLYSSEYAPFTLTPISLTFFGWGPGTGVGPSGAFNTITQTFTIPVPPLTGSFRYPVLNTLTFDAGWTDLYNVYWNQGTGSGRSHQFTNIVIATPEPGTWMLLLTGLGVLALVARRRRRSA